MKTTYADYEKRLINTIMDRPDWPVELCDGESFYPTAYPLNNIEEGEYCRLQAPIDSDGEPLVDGGKYDYFGQNFWWTGDVSVSYEQMMVNFKDSTWSFFDCPIFTKHKDEKMEEKHDGLDHLRKEADEWVTNYRKENMDGEIITKEHHCTIVNNPPVKKINGVLCYLQHCLECDKSEWVPVPEETTEPKKDLVFGGWHLEDGKVVRNAEKSAPLQAPGWEDIYTGNEEDCKKASEELKKWRPEPGEAYWFWCFGGYPAPTTNDDFSKDHERIYFGNYFRTKEECIAWARKEGLG